MDKVCDCANWTSESNRRVVSVFPYSHNECHGAILDLIGSEL
jgi:hypothetical protein